MINTKKLAIFSVNIEALSAGKLAYYDVENFLRFRKCLMVVDESSRIKTPGSIRTKRVLQLGKKAPYRRILTGTPVTQSPFDVFTQFKFLDPRILGFSSYHAFKHHYGIWRTDTAYKGGRSWVYEELVKFIRLDELEASVSRYSYRRTKEECLDLPKKIYQRITLQATPEQRKLYNSIVEDGVIEFNGFEMLTPLAITKLLRCQQVTGGFLPTVTPEPSENGEFFQSKCEWTPIPGANPKLDALLQATEDYPGKTIIWARFRAEISSIVKMLREKYTPGSVTELHGGVTGKCREEAVDLFQHPDGARFMVAQQQSGIGITLTAAKNVFYYSNPFSYEQRLQSEDRAHRIGTTHSVLYVDFEIEGTVDERVRDVLAGAAAVARQVTGDNKRRRSAA